MTPSKFSGVAEAVNNGDLYTTSMNTNDHELVADELKDFGGKNLGPSPGDCLCMSPVSCRALRYDV